MSASASSPRRSPAAVADLIAACIEGDDTAHAEFIARYGDLILRAVARQLEALGAAPPLREDAEDIRNDLLTLLLDNNARRLAGLREANAIDAWLVAVTRNHTVDYVRRWSRRMRAHENLARIPPPAPPPNPAECAINRETVETLRKAMENLSHEDRLVLALYYQHGLKYAEIAGLCGQNINTIATRLHRARARLRNLLDESGLTTAPPGDHRP
jgi:RNA polymerase sigma factor (sigma-70 family)